LVAISAIGRWFTCLACQASRMYFASSCGMPLVPVLQCTPCLMWHAVAAHRIQRRKSSGTTWLVVASGGVQRFPAPLCCCTIWCSSTHVTPDPMWRLSPSPRQCP
jgi:hypothetical protein